MKEKIIMNSLLEEREQLERILSDKKQDPHQLEKRIVVWANDLLLSASTENEPGQVQLIPYPEAIDVIRSPDPGEPKHQVIGNGTSNIRRSGKHQKIG